MLNWVNRSRGKLTVVSGSVLPLILCALLLEGTGFPAIQSQSAAYAPLTLTATTERTAFAPDEPVSVTLKIENTSGKKLKFQFQERDVQDKPLPYPAGLTVRVVDADGIVLTENDESRDEWWSAYLTWPQVTLSRKASKDRLTLDAGEELHRTVELKRILVGLEPSTADLPAGTYRVQFQLKGMKSNELTIDVGDPRTRLVRTRKPRKQ